MPRGGFVRYQRGSGRHGREIPRIKASADPRLRKIFGRIGVPPKKPFKPDAFQLKALAVIRGTDCLVSAPTGSGKTWIAQEAISRVYNEGGRAWYASPLKALSNAKYLEFGERFGTEHVGILTGDRRENADAPIIVGTTEILRNHLYDVMHQGTNLPVDLVVLDEAHFLGDEDRGVVWEEVMIYLPVRIHLLLLSATIKNARLIADWLESIRSKTCVVVEEEGRPVPLFPLFLHPGGRILPLVGSRGVDEKVQVYLNRPHPPLLAPPRQLPPFGAIMKVLRRYDLLPAIFFLKSRADCDAALEYCAYGADQSSAWRAELDKRIDELVEGHLHLAGHRQLRYLRNVAVAAHHSGQLPAWKLVIEHLMAEGLLDAVFATSTVAAGVNFPARSVVFLNSDRYNGYKFVPLNATEFHQMTGRAGRRGKDNIGFAVVIPGKFMDVKLIADLCISPPEDVLSQIRVDFSMVLNLLLSHSPTQIQEIFQRSFATYLNLVNQHGGLDQGLKEVGEKLMSFLPQALCGGPERVLDLTRKRAALIKEFSHLRREFKILESRLSKQAHLTCGRLFLDHRGRMYCVIKPQTRRDGRGVLASRVKGKISLRSKHLRMRWFRPERVAQILDCVLTLPSLDNSHRIKELMVQAAEADMPPVLDPVPMGEKERLELRPVKFRMLLIEKELEDLICNQCIHFETCHGKTGGAFKRVLENEFAFMWDAIHAVRMRLWNDFVRHLEFLKEEGFVTEDDKLTDDGVWASQLRLDQPLMIAEGLRKNLLPNTDSALLAALMASFVYDREMELELDESGVPTQLVRVYKKMRQALSPLMERKVVRGFEVRPIALWPAATIYAWANGQSWREVLGIAGMTEGDLAMLVSRTADNLRQIASLTNTYPTIARSAVDAIAMILREPVVAD